MVVVLKSVVCSPWGDLNLSAAMRTHARSIASFQDKINASNSAVLEQMALPKHKRKREYRIVKMSDIKLKEIWNLVGIRGSR